MMTSNPLLQTDSLPQFRSMLPEHVEPALDSVLARYWIATPETRPHCPPILSRRF
jgi:Zn-dependent oligopeptidase